MVKGTDKGRRSPETDFDVAYQSLNAGEGSSSGPAPSAPHMGVFPSSMGEASSQPAHQTEIIRIENQKHLDSLLEKTQETNGVYRFMMGAFCCLPSMLTFCCFGSHCKTVKNGHIGLGHSRGMPVAFESGTHYLPVTQLDKSSPTTDPHIQHGSINLLRLQQGEIAVINDNGNYRSLEGPGQFFWNATNCTLEGKFVPEDKERSIGPISLLRLYENEVAIIRNQGKYEIIQGPIYSQWNDPQIQIQKIINTNTNEIVREGPITIFRTYPNQETLIENGDGKLKIIGEPGLKIYTDNTRHITTYSLNQKEVHVQNPQPGLRTSYIHRLIVDEGEVGVMYKKGNLEILEAGVHYNSDPSTEFKGFMSLSQIVHTLEEEGQTRDSVTIKTTAVVFTQVVDPAKVVRNLGFNYTPEVLKRAEPALLRIIQESSAMHQIDTMKSSAVASSSNQIPMDDQALNIGDLNKTLELHLKDTLTAELEPFGVVVKEIAFNQISLSDELQTTLTQQATKTYQMRTKLAMSKTKAEMELVMAETDAKVRTTKVKTDAAVKKQEALTMKEVSTLEADAHSAATGIDAEAEANRIQKIAEAEAARIRTTGMAEVAVAESKSRITLDPSMLELEKVKVQAEAMRDALRTNTKVVTLSQVCSLFPPCQQEKDSAQSGASSSHAMPSVSGF